MEGSDSGTLLSNGDMKEVNTHKGFKICLPVCKHLEENPGFGNSINNSDSQVTARCIYSGDMQVVYHSRSLSEEPFHLKETSNVKTKDRKTYSVCMRS